MEEQHQTYSMRDVLAILFKHKYKILISFVVIAIGTLVIALMTPKLFLARAVVMVKFGREYMNVSELPGQTLPGINQGAIINTEMQLLTSSEIAAKVVKAIGPYNLYPDLAQSHASEDALLAVAALRFQKSLLVKEVKGSNLIEVYFQHQNPVLAAKSANIVVDFFQEKHVQVFSDNKSSFLDQQQKTYQQKLRGSEDRLANLKQANQIYSLDEQKTALIKQKADLETVIRTEESRIRELQERHAFWKNRDHVVSQPAMGSPTTSLRTQLNTLQLKEQQLLEKYNESSRTVQEVRREIELTKEQLRKQEEEQRQANLANIESDVKPLEVKVASMKRQLAETEASIRALDRRSREFTELKREITENEGNYQAYLKKSEEAKISEDLDRRKMTNVSVVEKASIPLLPIKGDRQKILGIGLFLSVAFSLGLAFVSEMLPQGLTIPHHAEKKLRLPLLVAVSLKK